MRDTKVVLKECKEYALDTVSLKLKEGFELLGGLNKFIKPNHTVLIKPDLYHCAEPNEAKTTHPNIITALAELIAKIGAKCIIADSPKGDFKQSNLDNTYVKTQMLQASNNGDATLNANDDIAIITNPKGEHCRDIYVIDAVNDADVIINVGKFRCDKRLGLIGCGQNLFGIIPGKFKELIKSRCYTLKSYYNYNIDLYEALENKIVLNLLDGIVGCEANNDPRILNAILIGENPYAVDSVALKIINQNPEEDLLLSESVRRNKCKFILELEGDKLEPLVCSDFNYTSFLDNVKSGSLQTLKREYNRRQKRPIISSKLCKGCKICVSHCPMNAIKMEYSDMGEYAFIDCDKCVNCFKCVEVCPYKVVQTKTPVKYSAINKMIKKSLKNKNDR
jgi:uncharacterized protein (DUF362 family)